jgi:hypothetical protein
MSKYRLLLTDPNDEIVTTRTLDLKFEDDLKAEEYLFCMKAREMYREAAFRAGKWPNVEARERDAS